MKPLNVHFAWQREITDMRNLRTLKWGVCLGLSSWALNAIKSVSFRGRQERNLAIEEGDIIIEHRGVWRCYVSGFEDGERGYK